MSQEYSFFYIFLSEINASGALPLGTRLKPQIFS